MVMFVEEGLSELAWQIDEGGQLLINSSGNTVLHCKGLFCFMLVTSAWNDKSWLPNPKK